MVSSALTVRKHNLPYFQSLGPRGDHFSAALDKFIFPSMNEREVVLAFFGTSENDNFIVFSDSKTRNQKTSSFYPLKVEFHLSK